MNQEFDFNKLRLVLDKWPDLNLENHIAKGVYERVRQVLVEAQKDGELKNSSDLIVLIRYILRNRSLNLNKTVKLFVPTLSDWPTAENWKEFGFSVSLGNNTTYLIEANPWYPNWMSESDKPLFEDSFAEKEVRKYKECPIDPFLKEVTHYKNYISTGQREVVRSALLLPYGKTLVISLPTGCGKSLVVQAPILLRGLEGPLTVCVVPTIALALDQERQFRDKLKLRNINAETHNFAWHSGLNDNERVLIKSAIRNGKQGILFCSPESITSSLFPSLFSASKKGLLEYFVVDEAHMIHQWGEGFRPEYQMMAGVRNQLLEVCEGLKLKTILMSATLTKESIRTIDALFGPPESIKFVGSVQLRPEPQYWLHHSKYASRKKVLEAVRFAPRPCILYSTTREDAIDWHKLLNENGFSRVSCFHGGTSTENRERIIEQWTNDEIDLICATSAFGVGVDKSDVRAIIHATAPESVDRFYQEVGRAGRDGKSSSSLIIYTDEDKKLAETLMKKKLIREETAFQRWLEMTENPKNIDRTGTTLEIDLESIPDHLKQQSSFNYEWNMHTLNLMTKAGMIEKKFRNPDLEENNSSEEGSEENPFAKIIVKIISQNSRNEKNFKKLLSKERNRTIKESNDERELLDKLLDGSFEFSSLLSKVYTIDQPNRAVTVIRACGGCPVDRKQDKKIDEFLPEPTVTGIKDVISPNLGKFKNKFSHIDVEVPVFIKLPSNYKKGHIIEIFGELISNYDINEISVPNDLRHEENIMKLHHKSANKILLVQSLESERSGVYTDYQLARATLLPDQAPINDELFLLQRPLHIMLTPQTVPDTLNKSRMLVEISTNILTFDQFMAGV